MSTIAVFGSDCTCHMTLTQAITPNILNHYSDPQNTIALIHFVDSNITKIGLYDMLEHEVYPWTIDYETLEDDYHDNLQFVMSFWKKHKPTPGTMNVEDAIIWVGFRSNPGFWYGKGDANSGFLSEGLEPYDDDENFILDSHPECRSIPNWVFEYVSKEIIYHSFD